MEQEGRRETEREGGGERKRKTNRGIRRAGKEGGEGKK